MSVLTRTRGDLLKWLAAVRDGKVKRSLRDAGNKKNRK
jgi:hypothetical protein